MTGGKHTAACDVQHCLHAHESGLLASPEASQDVLGYISNKYTLSPNGALVRKPLASKSSSSPTGNTTTSYTRGCIARSRSIHPPTLHGCHGAGLPSGLHAAQQRHPCPRPDYRSEQVHRPGRALPQPRCVLEVSTSAAWMTMQRRRLRARIPGANCDAGAEHHAPCIEANRGSERGHAHGGQEGGRHHGTCLQSLVCFLWCHTCLKPSNH